MLGLVSLCDYLMDENICLVTFSDIHAGIHPTTISDSFQAAAAQAIQVLTNMSTPVTLADRDSLLKSATTSLCSKVCTLQ